MESSQKVHFLHSKYVSYFFLIAFILLNVADFLGLLTADLDFFKKLLSWTIIIYLLYSASFTKIFIGKRHKIYDLVFIFAFSLIVIPKIIIYHIKDQKFAIFKFVAVLKEFLNFNNLQIVFLGILIIFILSILLSRKEIKKESFVGSFNIKSQFIHVLLLIFISLFFAFIIFNFFMEWFALAIDSFIIILGLFYYFFIFTTHHTKYSKHSKYLSKVSNFGNNLYRRTLFQFSDKQTFFLGVSLMLAAHLIVDIIVYLIPSITGFKNSLYIFNHTPFLSFLSGESIIEQIVFNSEFSLISKVPSFFLIAIILFSTSILYSLPLIILLRRAQIIRPRTHILPKVLIIFFFLGVISFTFLNMHIFKSIQSPITFAEIKDSGLKGVEIIPQNPIKDYTRTNLELLSLFILLGVLGIILHKRSKNLIHIQKLCILSTMIFLVFYVFTFSSSHLKENPFQQDNLGEYHEIYKRNISHFEIPFSRGRIIYFSNESYDRNPNNSDYILIRLNRHLEFFEYPSFKNYTPKYNKSHIIFDLGNDFNKTYVLKDHLEEFKSEIEIKNCRSLLCHLKIILEFITFTILLFFYITGLLYFLKVSASHLFKKKNKSQNSNNKRKPLSYIQSKNNSRRFISNKVQKESSKTK